MAIDRRHALVVVAAALLLTAAPGCENELPPGISRKTVTLDEVPPEVMKAAKKSLPGIEFSDAWKNLEKDGKLHSYEIRGRASNGKIREARVSPTGEILEME